MASSSSHFILLLVPDRCEFLGCFSPDRQTRVPIPNGIRWPLEGGDYQDHSRGLALRCRSSDCDAYSESRPLPLRCTNPTSGG
jgi:hypothetical protein